MNQPLRISTFVLCLLLLLSCGPASAQRPASDGVEVSLGLGAVVSPRPFIGTNAEVFPIPMLGIRYKSFFFEGTRLGFRGRPAEHFEASVFAAARFDGVDPDDSPALTGMEERDLSVDLGLRLAGVWDHFEVDLIGTQDLLDRSGGQDAELGLAFPFSAGSWRLKPRVSGRWLSDDVVDYYYGVRPSEARPGRAAYAGRDTWNLKAEMSFTRPFNNGWTLLFKADWERLGSEIADSPIVNENDSLGGFAAMVYTFGSRGRGGR
jgi:outer membrane protein